MNTHHQHGNGNDKTLGERNREHFDGVASTVFEMPWIVQLNKQIFNELRETAEWIGINKADSQNPSGRETKMLDYACGDGLASRALAPFMTHVRGLDISSSMVDQYNQRAAREGFRPEKMRAIHGDLVDAPTAPSPELDTPAFHDFDLVVMSMALHHVENPGAVIQKLANRLADGGVLLVVDWVSTEESGCAPPEWNKNAASHTISRMGFAENEVKAWFERAGLEDWGWRWFSERSGMLDQSQEQQLFLARGNKNMK